MFHSYLIDGKDYITQRSSSNFKVEIPPDQIQTKFRQLRVRNCMLTKSWYTVQTGYNDTVVLDDNGTERTITLTESNYSSTQLATHLQTLINAVSANTWTVVYDNQTMKMTITSSANMYFKWGTNELQSSTLFGFVQTDTASATSVVSTQAIDLQSEKYVHIKCDQIESFTFSGNDNDNSIVCTIPMVEVENGYSKSFEPNPVWIPITSSFNNILNFRVTFRNNREVDMNGQGFVLIIDLQ